MNDILNDLSDPALVGAIKQNLYDFCWDLREHWTSAVFYGNEKLRRWWSPIPMGFIFNAALSLQQPAADESDLIGETIAFFQSRGREEFDWWLAPGLETSGWGRQLLAHGLTLEQDPPGMALDLGALPTEAHLPAGLKIVRVEDAGSMKTWCKTFGPGYGLPPAWETFLDDLMQASLKASSVFSYLGLVNEQPVTVSSLFPAAGVAGIYNVATLPEWRGKGFGAAMTLQPLLEARRRGYRAAILQSSGLGYKVYQRLGFQELCKLDHYHWQAQV